MNIRKTYQYTQENHWKQTNKTTGKTHTKKYRKLCKNTPSATNRKRHRKHIGITQGKTCETHGGTLENT